MKKILQFTAAFLAAFLLFLTPFLVVSEKATHKSNQSLTTKQEKETNESREKESFSFLSVYIDGAKIFVAEIIIKQNKSVRAIPLNVKNKQKIYSEQGFYPLVTACQKNSGNNSKFFFKFNSESFVIITDRLGNLVYNDDNGNKVLLTGKQANDILTEQNFAKICQILTESVLKSNTKDKFSFVATACENNLSYPFLYNWFYE